MKQTIDLELLIVKFLNNEASKNDLLILESELEKAETIKIFKRLVKVNYIGNTLMQDFDVEQAKLNLKKKIKEHNKQQTTFYFKRALAVASIVIGCFILFKKFNSNSKNELASSTLIKPGTSKAILTLENGENLLLENGRNISLPNSEVKAKEIIYKGKRITREEKLTYNYLTVPKGGQYFLTLSDGTKIWLNSETKIKYPVQFVANSLREVSLIYGEAYFDVSPSTHHNGAKFKVTTKKQDVVVYGTEFNIRAYKESNSIYTTLVEGSIAISNGIIEKRMVPNTQSIVKGNEILISKVDIIYETAWKNGMFMFYKERLEDMLNSLSRWYNVEIEYEKEALKNEIFSGLLKKTDNIEELLSLLEKTQIVSFTINKNRIVVNQIN